MTSIDTANHALSQSRSGEISPKPNRRMLLIGLAAMAGLAACSTVSVPTGEGAGVSSSATATLAGIRTSAGLPALVPDAQLEQAALQQAGYMATRERMSHTTGWGRISRRG